MAGTYSLCASSKKITGIFLTGLTGPFSEASLFSSNFSFFPLRKPHFRLGLGDGISCSTRVLSEESEDCLRTVPSSCLSLISSPEGSNSQYFKRELCPTAHKKHVNYGRLLGNSPGITPSTLQDHSSSPYHPQLSASRHSNGRAIKNHCASENSHNGAM